MDPCMFMFIIFCHHLPKIMSCSQLFLDGLHFQGRPTDGSYTQKKTGLFCIFPTNTVGTQCLILADQYQCDPPPPPEAASI